MYHVTIQINNETDKKIEEQELSNDKDEPKNGEKRKFAERKLSHREIMDKPMNGNKLKRESISPKNIDHMNRFENTYSPEPRSIEFPANNENRLNTI